MPAQWYSLPTEIRLQILEDLVIAANDAPLANYTVVNHEWRDYMEKVTFQNITLDNNRVKEMRYVFWSRPIRMRSVKRVRLRVYLDKAIPDGPSNMASKPAYVFMEVVKELFDVMSEWSAIRNKGIILELQATCEGDDLAIDLFRKKKKEGREISEWINQHDDPKMRTSLTLANRESVNSIGNRALCSITNWYQDSRLNAVPRILHTPSGANTPYGNLSPVPCITTFAILRHTYHNIGPDLLKLMFELSLTHVEQVLYEKWRPLTGGEMDLWSHTWRNCVRHLPATLRCLTIFEEVHGELHIGKRCLISDQGLGRSITVATQHLRNMSLSFVIDSEDFFNPFKFTTIGTPPRLVFPNLQSLVLTSRWISLHARLQALTDILTSYADKIILGMPALRIYEIWNAGTGFGGAGFGGVFQYKFDGDKAVTLRHKTSWRTPSMTADFNTAFNAWRNVLYNMQPPRTLQASIVTVKAPKHYLDFLCELEMAKGVMSGVSRENACYEASIRELPVPYYRG